MNKQKRISLSAPHPPQSRSSRMRPILSLRSTRMKKMKGQNTDTADLGVNVTFVNPFSLPQQKPKTKMTLDELRDDISRYSVTNQYLTCGYVMGVSCADGGSYDETIPFEQQSVYGKWRMAGGKCASGWQLDEKCSSRCNGPKGGFASTYECKCSLLANLNYEC